GTPAVGANVRIDDTPPAGVWCLSDAGHARRAVDKDTNTNAEIATSCVILLIEAGPKVTRARRLCTEHNRWTRTSTSGRAEAGRILQCLRRETRATARPVRQSLTLAPAFCTRRDAADPRRRLSA